MQKRKTTATVIEVAQTSKNNVALRKLQRIINSDLNSGGSNIKISYLYRTEGGDYGWYFNRTKPTKNELELVERVVKKHLDWSKISEFGKMVSRVTLDLAEYFKGNTPKFLNSPDPRLDGKTPLEIMWEEGDKSWKKILNFIETVRSGDFV